MAFDLSNGQLRHCSKSDRMPSETGTSLLKTSEIRSSRVPYHILSADWPVRLPAVVQGTISKWSCPSRTFSTLQAAASLEAISNSGVHMTDLPSRKMIEYSSVADRWPTMRVTLGVVVTFCCALPLVWLVSNLFVYGLRTLSH